MTVLEYTPVVKVTLYKTTGRRTLDGSTPVSQNVLPANFAVDLTPYLGELGNFRVSKSVREPAGGFSITLADDYFVHNGAMESIYGLVEPMDVIEIRMRHNDITSHTENPTLPPIYMRGFVSEVQRNESISADGKPQRSITLSGQDYGKLWQMLQIKYLPQYTVGENYLSGFKLFERFGVGFDTTLKAADFVAQVMDLIVTPFLQSLLPDNSPNPATIKTDAISVANGVVGVGGVQNQEGTIYSLLASFGDVGAWNELYLEDREDGVYCVYRPNPSMDLQGNMIQPDAVALTPVLVNEADIISLSVSRSDAGVGNYFWTRAPRFELVSDIFREQFAMTDADRDTVILDQYPNSATQFYGMRIMETSTQQGGSDVSTINSGLPADQQATRDTSMVSWITNRRAIVVAQNKDNVLYESGTARIRANENIRAGCYVKIIRGSLEAMYYVSKVDLDCIPYQGLFMTLTLERGTGFIERVKVSSGASTSPYLAELSGIYQ
ncbi:hypothetical protein AWB80_07564 [Caballeronia pedi]|uniref:Uncharacterized protein n=1 Tax=Caballeronia pedi TaxID=1777141 RepID=A0A158DWR3_9BURK|nr:hypothetical protein [Caballeronia pedi]SAK98646.1 hypothetical protein AWB80_07564 [Caballeronia pedi]